MAPSTSLRGFAGRGTAARRDRGRWHNRRHERPPSRHRADRRRCPAVEAVLTPAALEFVATLHRTFNPRPLELMARLRPPVKKSLTPASSPAFCPKRPPCANGPWQVASTPADLNDRRVEITGPTERKMMINALNSGAKVFMADFEDALSPPGRMSSWGKSIADAIRRTSPSKTRMAAPTPSIRNRHAADSPRGWHLVEKHLLVDGEPISPASLTSASTSSAMPKSCSPRQRPLLLSAQDGKPPRSTLVE